MFILKIHASKTDARGSWVKVLVSSGLYATPLLSRSFSSESLITQELEESTTTTNKYRTFTQETVVHVPKQTIQKMLIFLQSEMLIR